MEPTNELVQLRLGFVDPIPWRSEGIRPLGLLGDESGTPQVHETLPHPEAVRQEVDRLQTPNRAMTLFTPVCTYVDRVQSAEVRVNRTKVRKVS